MGRCTNQSVSLLPNESDLGSLPNQAKLKFLLEGPEMDEGLTTNQNSKER